MRRALAFLGHVPVDCDVADTPEAQALGLQAFSSLDVGRGLLFPFKQTRSASFAMKAVAYPIDIVFLRNGHVARICSDIQPGDKRTYTASASAVVEVPGGFCASYGIREGAGATISRLGSHTRVAAGEAYSTPPERTQPGDHNTDVSPDERFRDRDLPPISSPNATDNYIPLETQIGYDPTTEQNRQFEGPPFRPHAHAWRRAQSDSASEMAANRPTIADPEAFMMGAVRALASSASKLRWEPDRLNPGMEYAVVTPKDVAGWMHALGAGSPTVIQAATSTQGMEIIGDSLVVAGVAQDVRDDPMGSGAIVLTRDLRG